MRRSILLSLAIAMIILVSCEPLTTTTPPSIQVTPELDLTVEPGDTAKYEVIISSDTDLNTASFEAMIGDQVIAQADTTFPANAQAAILNYGLIIPEGIDDGTIIDLTFFADNQGEYTEVFRTINVVITAGEINTYTAVIMADLENPNGSSFFSLDNNELMTLSAARDNSEKVDLIYYYGNTNKATLCNATDEDVKVFTDRNDLSIVDQLATKNNTELAATNVSVDDFAAMADDALISVNMPTEVFTAVNQLAEGQVIYAKTVSGKMALIHVQSITGGQGTSEITIEVKIQK